MGIRPEGKTTHRTHFFLPALAFGFIALIGAQTPPPKPGPPVEPPFAKGVLYGRIVDIAGKPIPDATVALEDKNGKVLAWTSTDSQGAYALAADPMEALNLRPSKRRGLLEACARAVGDLVILPVKVVGGAVANPEKTLQAGAVSVATGTPAPMVARAATGIPSNASASQTAKNARDLAIRTAGGEGPVSLSKGPIGTKGRAQLLVAAPSYKDAKVIASAYWMESATADKTMGMQAWLEAVKMAPTVGPQKSDIELDALTLAVPVVAPTLVAAGATVSIEVKLIAPPGPDHKVRIFARECRKDTVIELMPKDGPDKTLFCGTMTLDPKTPSGVTTICIAALRGVPMEVKLDPKKADPLHEFVQRCDDLQAGKPYEYDPRIMASENRLDVKITVLPAKKGKPLNAF